MINLYKKFVNHPLVRYIFVGGVSYVIEMLTLGIFFYVFQLTPTVAVAISFWVGFFVSFALQKLLAFRNKSTNKRHLSRQFLIYSGLVAFNYSFTIAFVWLFEPILSLFLSRTIALGITTAWNFLIYSKIIFKNKDIPPTSA